MKRIELKRLTLKSLFLIFLMMTGHLIAQDSAEENIPNADAFELPVNKWVKIADVPGDPFGREVEPGRGAYWSYEPKSGKFLRYGGYTPSEDNSLWTFDLMTRKWENPLLVDYTWPPPTNRPAAGPWWSMAYDTKRNVIWLFGGESVLNRTHPELLVDMWCYNPINGTFTAMKTPNTPSFSSGCRIVYDSKNDLIIRATAYNGDWPAIHNRDKTFVYNPNNNTWDRRETPKPPKEGLAMAMVFDPGIGKTIYLAIGADNLADTWTYDAATNVWEQMTTNVRPPARVVAGVTYDPHNKCVILCGGAGHPGQGYGYIHNGGGLPLTDTWVFDSSKKEWRQLTVGAPVIPKLRGSEPRFPRFEHFCAMDYDSKHQTVVLSSPTMGVWALRYQPDGTPKKAVLKLAALPKPVKPTIPERVFPQYPPNKRLLDLPLGEWVQLNGGWSFGGAEVPMIYDESTGFCIKYGGCGGGGTTFASGYTNDLIAYDPATERWIALRPTDPCGPPRPENGCTRSYAYDPVRKAIWFAGGVLGNNLAWSYPPGFQGTLENSTWRYDGLHDRFDLIATQGKSPVNWDRVVCCYDRANDTFIFNTLQFHPKTKTWASGGEPGLPAMHYTYACYIDSLQCMFAVKPVKTEGGVPETLLYDAKKQAWQKLSPSGDVLPAWDTKQEYRPATAYDPHNDMVLAIFRKRAFLYNVKTNTWKELKGKMPDGTERFVFDTRHKVFLACTTVEGANWAMWAYKINPK